MARKSKRAFPKPRKPLIANADGPKVVRGLYHTQDGTGRKGAAKPKKARPI